MVMSIPWEQIERDERRKRKREEKDQERAKKRREREEAAYVEAGGSYAWLPVHMREIVREEVKEVLGKVEARAAAEAEKEGEGEAADKEGASKAVKGQVLEGDDERAYWLR